MAVTEATARAQPADGENGLAGVSVRPPVAGDVEPTVRLINTYAARGEMLPKSLNQVYQNVRDFVVAERAGEIIGCGALHVLWDNLAEVRSLAVADGSRRRGIGGAILQALLADAQALGLAQVFALTCKPRFFERWGFRTVEREALPRKIWLDCIDCIKFPQCDEVAVLRDLVVQQHDSASCQAPHAAPACLPASAPRHTGDGHLIRRPRMQDVPPLLAIINARAAEGQILPRSPNYVCQNMRDFVVAEQGGRVVACGGLHVLWNDLGEVRALASAPEAPAGAEQEIVRALLSEGRRLGLARVFAFTYTPSFFVALGFAELPRERLPRIAWRECIDCTKFPAACDEAVVSIDL